MTRRTVPQPHAAAGEEEDGATFHRPSSADDSLEPPSSSSPGNGDGNDKDPKDDEVSQVIHTSLLIYGPASQKPLKDASVVLQHQQIAWVGPTSKLPDTYRKSPSTRVPVLLPGLWDAHIHLLGLTSFDFKQILAVPDVAKGFRLARNCHDLLMAGITSVRCLGGSGPEVAAVLADPHSGLLGPHIYAAGSALSQTAGHGDVFDLPYGAAAAKLGLPPFAGAGCNDAQPGSAGLCLCDGADECRRAVRLQIRRGAKVIKVFSSGGVLSIADDPMRQQFSDGELGVIVEEANRLGRMVAAHAHGKEGIMAALRAGVGSIEHGTFMDEECCALMKERGVVYVPTRTVLVEAVKHPELMSPESYRKLLRIAEFHTKAYRLAVKMGVTVVLGTDSGISTPGLGVSIGIASGRELGHAVEAGGMGELEAIEAATANGPLCVGGLGMAPKTGRVEKGYDADLVGLSESPLDGNMGVFTHYKKITHVWKSGTMVKGSGKDVQL